MRTLKQIIAEITRDAPSARVMGGERSYARIEIPGSGGAHAILYPGGPDESGTAATYHDADDKGLIDVNILDPKGRGLSFHLAYGTPDVQEAHDRAVLFLNNRIEKNKRKEISGEN